MEAVTLSQMKIGEYNMSFASEDQLLIQCSRVEMTIEAKAQAARLLRQELDWDYILEVSIRHAVSPLLYYGLNQVVPAPELHPCVPTRIMDELRKLYQNTQVRNRRLYSVLGEICQAFARAGIPALGLKDLQLAREVYPDIGLRPIGDLDILIHPEDYGRVAGCMAELGFAPMPDPNIPFTLKYALAHHFRRPTDNIWVDMQWGIMQREWDVYQEGAVVFEIERMWRGARPMTLDEVRTDTHLLVPKPEDMLFHLCLHMEGHGYSELVLFCDIVEMLRHYDSQFDWPYFLRMTKQYKAESSVYYALFLVQRLFRIALPKPVLAELAPAYFNAALFEPLFGNLTGLHLSLDEIQRAVSPPCAVLTEFDAVVRRHTLGAMQAYKAIDTLVSTFINTGGKLAILEGRPSEKEFPAASLRPFEDIQLLILDQDLSHMRQVLSNNGLTPAQMAHSAGYVKRWEVRSVDPILADGPTLMTLRLDVEQDPNAIFRRNGIHVTSKKDVALRALRGLLRGRHPGKARIPVRIRITALSPEALLLYLSTRLGREQQGRLFGLCSLLEFFRGHPEPPDWQQFAEAAQRLGVSHWASEGLRMVSDLVEADRVPQVAVNLLARPGPPPRVLERARYDPASWGRYKGFKNSFFYLFTFLSVAGIRGKGSYLFKSFFGDPQTKPVLPRLLREVGTSVFSASLGSTRTARDFAYWIEPEGTAEAD